MIDSSGKNAIKIIIVDDSFAFRWTLRDLFEGASSIMVAGEAANGIEALELVIKLRPDVILMDFEMPLMDGMTALQHLMIHTPTPTIMFSRLTREGTARCFDALKSGAVDFLSKENIHPGKVPAHVRNEIIKKVICASSVSVKAVEPVFPNETKNTSLPITERCVLFCEECGSKKQTSWDPARVRRSVVCSNCGEQMLLEQGSKIVRTSCVSIIAAGEGAYVNLLKFIPMLRPDLAGALLILIDGKVAHVDAFTEYLDSISPITCFRIRDGLNIYGGNCYVGCDVERIYLKPFSAHYTLKFDATCEEIQPLDVTLISISKIFKDRTAVVFLSGDEAKGERGVETVLANGGNALVLNPDKCLHKRMVQNMDEKFPVLTLADEEELSHKIISMHAHSKSGISTA